MNVWWIAAALLAALTTVVHVVFGGRDIDRPLRALASDDRQMIWGNHLCWHLVTIELAMLTASFGWAAATGEAALAVMATLVCLAAAVWNLTMVVRHRLGFGEFPQWIAFLATSGLGVAGLLA